jgi:hypothetical protein
MRQRQPDQRLKFEPMSYDGKIPSIFIKTMHCKRVLDKFLLEKTAAACNLNDFYK